MSNLKEALERPSSPEQLDRLLVIIRPSGWAALICLAGLTLAILVWSFFGNIPITTNGSAIFFNPAAIQLIQSESDGFVEEVYVMLGDRVKKGDQLITIRGPEGKKGSRTVNAPADGRILRSEVLRGEAVEYGKNLFWLLSDEEADKRNLIYSFFSIEEGEQIKPGMRAQISFDNVRAELYGKMEGTVIEIPPFAASTQDVILKSIPSTNLQNYLIRGDAPLVVMIQPTADPQTPSGYKWTTKQGPPVPVLSGSVGHAVVFLEEKKPINYLIPIEEKE